MPFPRRLLTDDEEIVREFRQHWRLLIIPIFWVVAAAVAVYFVWRLPPDNTAVDAAVTLVIAGVGVTLGVRPLVRWWFTWYVLTTERLITRSGIVAREGIDIPVDNITNVLFSQGFIERLLRSGDLIVESAGTGGQSHFANIYEPDEFQALIYKTREQRMKVLEMGLHHTGGDAADRLRKLAELHRDGMISDEEFVQRRGELLDDL